jgi:hypothetical protein
MNNNKDRVATKPVEEQGIEIRQKRRGEKKEDRKTKLANG